MTEQLDRFLNLLYRIDNGDFDKRIVEKYDQIQKAIQLFEDDALKDALSEDEKRFPEALKRLTNMVRSEAEDNEKRFYENKKQSTYRFYAFDLFASVLKFQYDVVSPNIQFEDLIFGLTICLEKTHTIRSVSSQSNGAWMQTLELVGDAFALYPPIDLEFVRFKKIWNLCLEYCQQAFDGDNRAERVKLVDIIAHIAPKIHTTLYFNKIKEVIDSISALVDGFTWISKDPTRMSLINLLNALIESNSERNRDYLLEKFFHLSDKLVPSILIAGPNDVRITSPRKDERRYDPPIAESDFYGSLYRFTENLLILSYPDCEKNSLNYSAASEIVEQCCHRFMIELEEKSTKCSASGRKFVVPKNRLSLLSRVFVLKHLLDIEHDSACEPQAAKKPKSLPILNQLINEGQFCHYQVILEVMIRWRHRLRNEDLDEIASALIHIDKKTLKKDDKLELFLRIMGHLFCDKRNLSTNEYEDFWNWAISLLQMPAIQESACHAISGIISYYEDVLLTTKADDIFKVLIFQIAQFNTYSKAVIKLIHLVITKFEFDERASFRADIIEWCSEWTFRSQILYAVLKFSVDDESVRNLILAILTYHPQEIPYMKECRAVKKCKVEEHLAEMFCKNVKIAENCESFDFSIDNTIPRLICRIVGYLDEIWKLITSEDFDERQIFLWKICCFIKANFRLEISNTQLEFFEHALAKHFDDPKNHGFLDKLDIECLWEESTTPFRKKISELSETSVACQRYRLFFGDSVPLSKEILEVENIKYSRHIDSLFLPNIPDLSFNDIILVITKFSSALKPQTNELLISKLVEEIEQEVQLSGSQETSLCLCHKFAFTVCKYIKLEDLNFPDNLKTYLFTNVEIVAELSPLIPFNFFTDGHLEELVPVLSAVNFCKLFRVALDSMSHQYVPIAILKGLLLHSYSFLEEYIPNFSEYVEFWKPLLAYFKTLTNSVDREWDLKLLVASNDLLHNRLLGRSTVVDHTYSPNIFTFPICIINKLLQDECFQNTWFKWSEETTTFHRTLRNLRCLIYRLRQSDNAKLNYPLVILRSILIFIKNRANIPLTDDDDMCSIITSLFHDAVRFCSDEAFSLLLRDYIHIIDEVKLKALRILVIVDTVYDNYTKLPKTIKDLQEVCADASEMSSLHWFKQYMDFKHVLLNPDDYAAIIIPSFLDTEITELMAQNNFEADLAAYHFQLFGFWEAFAMRIEKEPDINVLHCVIPFWMFFPRLRSSLTKLLVLFPPEKIDSVLRDYRFFMGALKKHKEFQRFIPEFVYAIAFDPTVIYEESVTKAIYDVICASLYQSSQPLSQFIEPENEEEISPSNYAGIILQSLSGFLPSKPWMFKFLSMAYKMPLCANLSLLRFLNDKNENICQKLIEQLNSTFSSLILEDNEHLKSRHPSSNLSGSIFAFNNYSQLIYTTQTEVTQSTSNVFESENAIMFLFAAVNLTEMLSEWIQLFDLRQFSKCLLRAKMFKEAHYFLKLHIDFLLNSKRAHFAFQKPGSFMEVVEDDELRNLMMDILIGLKDYKAVGQMPLKLRTVSKARSLIAECKHDWGAMASIRNTAEEKDVQARALLALGSLPSGCSKEIKYEAVIQLSSWNEEANMVSYPKKAGSHWEQLYSVIKRHRDGRLIKSLKFLNLSTENISSKIIIDPVQLTECRHLQLLENLVRNRKCYIPDGVLRCSFHLANISRDDVNGDIIKFQDAVEAVVAQSKVLRSKGAILLSLKLLDSFDAVSTVSGPKIQTNISLQSATMEIAVERSKSLIGNHDTDMASFILTELTTTTKKSDRTARNLCRAYQLLAKLGNCGENLMKACDVAELVKTTPLYNKNLIKLAMFYENIYQMTQDYMESGSFKLKQEFVESATAIPNKPMRGLTNDEKLKQLVLKKEKEVEESDIVMVKQRRLDSLQTCINSYIQAIINGNHDRTIVYRVVALMIQNTDEREVMASIKMNIERIPTNVWLPVLNVLSSHLFSDKLAIADVVKTISINTIKDYPYIATRHFLFYMRDTSINPHGTYPRNDTVKKLFDTCCKCKKLPQMKEIIENLIKADRCFIEIGTSDFQNPTLYTMVNKNRYEMTQELRIMKHMSFFTKIPIPTASQPIFPPDDSRNYDIQQFTTISKIDKICMEAGGLSKPKVVSIKGSDDKRYKLIFKGEDLRQDSLVQQLFAVQNLLMEQNPANGSNNFSPLRTYAVVPLSPDCGIIEWCEGTISLCEYLVATDKRSGAHKYYRPDDIIATEAIREMKNVPNPSDSTRVFLEICQKIQPVFRFFFYSKFKSSKDFHDAIQRYTVSLANWSIVCYIVGLGDRHLNNILIDEQRGELVHIDLGQIFEYSKRTLPIPERIPFRLTRDLVDPLLIDGVYGRLKDIAVHTMTHMRENARVIIGIASSLVHDPVSTFAAVANQTNNRHFVAEAAIQRLKEKLAGRDSSLAVMDPEQQVCKLFEDAMNPENLSKVFVGWMPFI